MYDASQLRFATTLATLRKHALSGTRGILCVVLFYSGFIEQNVKIFFFLNHICDHVFSYSSDYGVVISCACSVLSVDRRQFPEQEKYLVAYITNSGACNLNSLF